MGGWNCGNLTTMCHLHTLTDSSNSEVVRRKAGSPSLISRVFVRFQCPGVLFRECEMSGASKHHGMMQAFQHSPKS